MKAIKQSLYPFIISSMVLTGCAATKPDPRVATDISIHVHENHVAATLWVRVNNQTFRIHYDNQSSLFAARAVLTSYLELENKVNRVIRKRNYPQLEIWQTLDKADGLQDSTINPAYLKDFLRHPRKYCR